MPLHICLPGPSYKLRENRGVFGKQPFLINDVYQASHPARLTLRVRDSQGLRPPTRLIFRGVLFLAKCLFTILENIVPCPSYSRDLESRDLLVTSYFAPAATTYFSFLTQRLFQIHLSHLGTLPFVRTASFCSAVLLLRRDKNSVVLCGCLSAWLWVKIL